MTASKLFTAIATFAIAGAAYATDLPVANAAATTAATTAATATAATAAAPAAAAAAAAAAKKSADRNKVKAEAIEAAGNRRATEASQFDWFMK